MNYLKKKWIEGPHNSPTCKYIYSKSIGSGEKFLTRLPAMIFFNKILLLSETIHYIPIINLVLS